MPDRFTDKWGEREESLPFGAKVKTAVRSPSPLKPRLDHAIQRLDAQILSLDRSSSRLSERDKSLFAKVVEAFSKHDPQRANALANELTEVRKTERTVLNARLALEQIALRLRTVTELGDMVSAIGPVIGVLSNVKAAIAGVLPDAGRELEQIGIELSGIMGDVEQTTGLSLNFAATSEEAQKILNEAATITEERTKEKFPELPTVSQKPQTKT